jgi:hypothetical protein
MVLKRSSIAALALALSACGSQQSGTAAQALQTCNAGAQHVHVHDSGEIVRVLGTRRTYSGDHEGFLIALRPRVFKVEDNVDITGYIPLHRGDRVTLDGQFECNDDVIHWTHRDPRGRHPAGYIEVNGTRYQ